MQEVENKVCGWERFWVVEGLKNISYTRWNRKSSRHKEWRAAMRFICAMGTLFTNQVRPAPWRQLYPTKGGPITPLLPRPSWSPQDQSSWATFNMNSGLVDANTRQKYARVAPDSNSNTSQVHVSHLQHAAGRQLHILGSEWYCCGLRSIAAYYRKWEHIMMWIGMKREWWWRFLCHPWAFLLGGKMKRPKEISCKLSNSMKWL